MPSPCKAHLKDRILTRKVANTYRTQLLTIQEVAALHGVNHLTARVMIERCLSPEEFKALKSTRYHKSKLAEKNPQYGREWASDCEDGRGYLTRLVKGKRYFVHRIVFADYLGIPVELLPESLVVHHIDENPKNNTLDNLAASTDVGHQKIHERYQTPGEDLLLKKLSVREGLEYMTSK